MEEPKTAFLGERICNLCGLVKQLTDFHKRSSSKNGVRSYCKECERNYSKENAEKIKVRRGKRENKMQAAAYQRGYATTIRGRASRIFAGARRRAREKGLTFEIELVNVIDMLNEGICAQTKIPFVIDENANHLAPSLDRKESHSGYTLNNVQMVCCAYNLGKQHLSDQEYKAFIVAAAKNLREPE